MSEHSIHHEKSLLLTLNSAPILTYNARPNKHCFVHRLGSNSERHGSGLRKDLCWRSSGISAFSMSFTLDKSGIRFVGPSEVSNW